MAISILTPINSIVFQSELDFLQLSAPGESSVTLTITSGNQPIFTNEYRPDSSNMISVYDLGKLLDPFLHKGSPASNLFGFSANGTNLVVGGGNCMVISCNARMPEPASSFIDKMFLSDTIKCETCSGRTEYLPLFTKSSSQVKVVATYYNPSSVSTSVREFSKGSVNGYSCLDVSPSQFEDAARGRLVGYRVCCGARYKEYPVLPSMPEADPAFLFENTFGCPETIYLSGTKTHEPKFTRSAAMIGGRMVTYNIDCEDLYEAKTGILPQCAQPLALALGRSKNVWLMNADGSVGDNIDITDCEIKTSNEDDALADYKFTYRRSDTTPLFLTKRPPKVFDDTFDEKFE